MPPCNKDDSGLPPLSGVLYKHIKQPPLDLTASLIGAAVGAKEIEKIAEFAVQKQIDLAVVAPDNPLVMGAGKWG